MRSVWALALVFASGVALGQVAVTLTAPAAEATATASEVKEMRNKLADWAQLGRYRADDAALPAPAAGEKRVVFYGSSTTDNWGRRYDSVFFPGKPYVNRGISGQTTPQMLVRFQQDVVALKPAAVVFLGGSNDVAGNTGASTLGMIEDNIRSMVAIAKANGIKMILASQQPTIEFPWNKGTHPAPMLLALSAWEKEYAAAQGLGYVDYYSALVGPDGSFREGLSVDGVHPTAKGYALMTPVVERVIAQVLQQP
jgi:lysophospholipase L1-like esterase